MAGDWLRLLDGMNNSVGGRDDKVPQGTLEKLMMSNNYLANDRDFMMPIDLAMGMTGGMKALGKVGQLLSRGGALGGLEKLLGRRDYRYADNQVFPTSGKYKEVYRPTDPSTLFTPDKYAPKDWKTTPEQLDVFHRLGKFGWDDIIGRPSGKQYGSSYFNDLLGGRNVPLRPQPWDFNGGGSSGTSRMRPQGPSAEELHKMLEGFSRPDNPYLYGGN